MTTSEAKTRKKVVVEEVSDNPAPVPAIEVPAETPPHVEPGIHEEVKPVTPAPEIITPKPQSLGPGPFVIIIPGIFLLGALLGGIYFYQTSVNKVADKTPTTTQEPTTNSVPTSSSEPKVVDLTKYTIKILNGSGIKGEAGKVQDLLESAKFEVSTTGNADSYGYTKTVIQVKSDVDKDFIAKLTETLSETYSVDTKTQSLSTTSSDSVIVIVGSTKS